MEDRNAQGSSTIKGYVVAIVFIMLVLSICTITASIILKMATYYVSDQSLLFETGDWLTGFTQNCGTGLIGSLITFLLIDWLLGTNKERIEKAEERAAKERLAELEHQQHIAHVVRRMRSDLPGDSHIAVLEAIESGWFQDGSLRNQVLYRVELKGEMLTRSNLYGVDLSWANLTHTNLMRSDLRSAELTHTLLQQAMLAGANLQDANLSGADLQHTNLAGADLRNADLQNANLTGAILREAQLDNAKGLNVSQLRLAQCMQKATMADGSLYDGRFNLPGDIKVALDEGLDPDDHQAMADFYNVSLKTYMQGQRHKP